MTAMERRKGAAGEREVVAIFRDAGIEARREREGRIGADLVLDVPGYHVSVKRHETLRLPLWIAEAEAAGDGVPIVAFRRSRMPWYAAVPLDVLASLLAAAESTALAVWNRP